MDTGDRIAAHTARCPACEAGIIPVVLSGRREVLDVGRLLCPTHHRTAHDPRYDTRVLADHQIEFTLRC